MVARQRILQVLDAKGWVAVYDHGSHDMDDLRTKPLVCWALVEDEAGLTQIIGIDADYIAGIRETAKFLAYVRDHDPLTRFKKRAHQHD
jgi:hypothetical protein